MLAGLAPPRRRLVLGAGLAALALLAAGLVALAVTGDDAPAAVAQDRPGPVIVVPGYGGSTSGPDRLADVLRRLGKDVTVLALPDGGQGDLGVQAAALGAAVDEVRRRTAAASVDIVGYSAGGVVARLYVKDHGGRATTRRVVTLGSPHHGTALADAGGQLGVCPAACQQLRPDSDLLRRLNAGDETPNGPQYVSIWTTQDEVVLPPDSARLDGALDLTVQSVCPSDDVTHGGLPNDPTVQRIVETALAMAAPSADTLGCAGLLASRRMGEGGPVR